MTWTKIDSAMPDDPRILQLDRAIRWMHVEGMVWCNQHGTDGEVPTYALRRVTDQENAVDAAAELVAVGLWLATDSGWTIVDFLVHQPLHADEERTRVLAKKRQRVRRQHLGGDHTLCSPKYCREASSRVTNAVDNDTRTDPTRPVPKGRGGEGKGKVGSASSDAARSAKRPSSSATPKAKVTVTAVQAPPAPSPKPRPRCPHGVEHGLTFPGPFADRLRCPECSTLIPDQKTPDVTADWIAKHPGLDSYLVNHEPHCTDADADKLARRLASQSFSRTSKEREYTVTPPHLMPMERMFHAFTVDHLEPGRLAHLMTEASANAPTKGTP